jgi:high-affinity nickel permease
VHCGLCGIDLVQVPYADFTPLQAAVGVVQKVLFFAFCSVLHSFRTYHSSRLYRLVSFLVQGASFRTLNMYIFALGISAYILGVRAGFEADHSREHQSKAK